MKTSVACALGLALVLAVCGCGSDDAKSGNAAAAGDGGAGTETPAGNGGEPTTAAGDACHEGCVTTIAAACSNGPADQASCEGDCRALEAGKCGAEYATLQTCAKDQALTCSAQGQPSVAACSDEQTAFVACLGG